MKTLNNEGIWFEQTVTTMSLSQVDAYEYFTLEVHTYVTVEAHRCKVENVSRESEK